MDMANRLLTKLPPGTKRVFVQAPEGLKPRILEIAQALEQKGLIVLIGVDATFGGCDLRDKEALHLGCDVLIHIGHSDFGVKPVLPVIYEPYQLTIDPVPLLEKHAAALAPYRTLSVLTTIQFEPLLKPAATWLEQHGHTVLFAKQIRNQKEGLLLGCDWTAALPLKEKVDAFLYIGSGIFHPLGLARMTSKPVLAVDIESQEFVDYAKEKYRLEKVKAFHLEQAKEARTFGIMVTVKEGQLFLKQAEQLKRVLEHMHKKAWILVADQMTPDKLAGMHLEVLVNCACPRMDEDFSLFKKPILNPEDVFLLEKAYAQTASI